MACSAPIQIVGLDSARSSRSSQISHGGRRRTRLAVILTLDPLHSTQAELVASPGQMGWASRASLKRKKKPDPNLARHSPFRARAGPAQAFVACLGRGLGPAGRMGMAHLQGGLVKHETYDG